MVKRIFATQKSTLETINHPQMVLCVLHEHSTSKHPSENRKIRKFMIEAFREVTSLVLTYERKDENHEFEMIRAEYYYNDPVSMHLELDPKTIIFENERAE